jgi:DNA polymerase III delta prime subunit
MKKIDNSHFIWSERYRPQTIDDVIITEDVRNKFKSFIKDERFPHILLTSTNPGLGKTSITTAIIKDLDADVLWLNGSQDRGIDTFKSKTKEFITSVSIDDSPKIVVIDEADGLTKDAQKILRGLIEEFSKNSTFIMTANYKEQLIEPLRNRFIHFDFDNIYNQNKKEIGLQIFNRLSFILENEGVKFDKASLSPVVSNMFPSVRKMVLILQQSVEDGNLVLNESMINLNSKFTEILNFIKEKKFIDMRKSLQDLDDPGSLYTYIFKNLDEWFVAQSQPQVVLLCAKYQDMHENARDKAITSAAFGVELMGTPSIEFKKD